MALMMALCTACGKKEEVKESRTVSYDELGLTYTTPDAWREFETTNLYPSAYSTNGVFAVIDYSNTTKNWEENGVYVGKAAVAQLNGGGNANKKAWMIDPTSWTAGAPENT